MPRLRHPRIVLLIKLALYLVTAAALGALFLTGAGFLGVVAVAGAASALLDVGATGALLPIVLLGTATVLALGSGVVIAARRIDRYVVSCDREPEPLEALKRRYVESDIDESELERRLDALLDDRDRDRPRAPARGGSTGRESARRSGRRNAEQSASIPVRE